MTKVSFQGKERLIIEERINKSHPLLDWMQVLGALTLVAIVGNLVYASIYRSHLDAEDLPSELLSYVKQKQVVGEHPAWLGDPTAPFTLVEFADYQYLPCKVEAD